MDRERQRRVLHIEKGRKANKQTEKDRQRQKDRERHTENAETARQ